MSDQSSPIGSLSVQRQLGTCALLIVLAAVIAAFSSSVRSWNSGQTLAIQGSFVAVLAALAFAASFIALRVPFIARRVHVPAALAEIDLSGSKPVVVGLAAGLGEELLFRAALLPLLGLWGSSVLFTFAHVRTASFATGWPQRLAFLSNTFIGGVVLGLVFIHLGLVAAIGLHAIIDIVSLSTIHQVKPAPCRASNLTGSSTRTRKS